MAEKTKKGRVFDLPETKGAFQVKGIVTGTEKDNFYIESKTKNNRTRRAVNFGVQYDANSTLYESVQGFEQDNVYFTKFNGNEKPETVAVPWTQRFSFNREGFRLFGKNIGVSKIINDKGQSVNDKKILTDFDSCKALSTLKDDVSVYTKGAIEYSSYTDNQGNSRKAVKLVPSQVSLCSEIDFNSDKFKKQNDFNQFIVFMGINKEKDDDGKDTGRFVISAKIVTRNSIEDAEFIVLNPKIANTFKKALKPYYAIKVHGHVEYTAGVSEIEDDEWGEADPMKVVTSPGKLEFIVTGATESTIDTELYSKAKIDEAISKIVKASKAENEFNPSVSDDDDWDDLDDDDSFPWE